MNDDAIEQVLHRLWARAVLNGLLTGRTHNYEVKEAAQQIRQYILDEVVGEDIDLEPLKPLPNILQKAFGANELKATQRKKL